MLQNKQCILKKLIIFILFVFSFLFLVNNVKADILVLKDGMILNGKIIQEKNEVIKFSNYHGEYNIKNELVVKKIITKNYKEDIMHYNEMGLKADVSEIKKNYQAGEKKINEIEKKEFIESSKKVKQNKYSVCLASFINKNQARLGEELKTSYGGYFSADVFFDNFVLNSKKRFYFGGRGELSYLYSEEGERSLTGYSFTIGPALFIPLHYMLNTFIAPQFGIGSYHIKTRENDLKVFRYTMNIQCGINIILKNIYVFTGVQYHYVYDKEVPLIGVGARVGAGYLF